MKELIQLRNRITNKLQYPITVIKAIFSEDGRSLTEILHDYDSSPKSEEEYDTETVEAPFVKYTSQSLSLSQQARARENLGIYELGRQDLLNVSAINNDEPYETLEDAIDAIQENYRKPGLMITFRDQNNQWYNYQFIGTDVEDTQWEDPTKWSDKSDIKCTFSGITTKEVGGVPKGTVYDNVAVAEVLGDILCPYVAPTISSSVTPTVMLYGKSYNITLSCTGNPGSKPLSTMLIDGTSYDLQNATSSTRKTKSINGFIPSDGSVTSHTYQMSVTEAGQDGRTISGTAKTTYVGGIFMFYNESLNIFDGDNPLYLDFVNYGCQGEKTTITSPNNKTFYTITHDTLAYFYIIAPRTDAFKLDDPNISVKSDGTYAVPMEEVTFTNVIKQGETLQVAVPLNMRMYRSKEKHNPGTIKITVNQ